MSNEEVFLTSSFDIFFQYNSLPAGHIQKRLHPIFLLKKRISLYGILFFNH